MYTMAIYTQVLHTNGMIIVMYDCMLMVNPSTFPCLIIIYDNVSSSLCIHINKYSLIAVTKYK